MTARLPNTLPSAETIGTMLRQCRAWMAELAAAECWPPGLLQDLEVRLAHQPADTLTDTAEHFRQRVATLREQQRQHARAVPPSIPPRWCPDCDGSCVGTRRSCLPGQPPIRRMESEMLMLTRAGWSRFTTEHAAPRWLHSWREGRTRNLLAGERRDL
jgi:hypothetical protein